MLEERITLADYEVVYGKLPAKLSKLLGGEADSQEPGSSELSESEEEEDLQESSDPQRAFFETGAADGQPQVPEAPEEQP